MRVAAIDPGPEESALVVIEGDKLLFAGIEQNQCILLRLRNALWSPLLKDAHLVIEQVASYGMSVGAEVFETCTWSGKFAEAWSNAAMDTKEVHRMKRKEVVLEVCGSTKAKDSNVRQAMIDRWGPPRIGKGKTGKPGPTHEVTADSWQALALGTAFRDIKRRERWLEEVDGQ